MADDPDSTDATPDPLNLRDAGSVVEWLLAGAAANRGAKCRQKSIEVISFPGRLIATGDLHDNPVHYQKLLEAANLPTDGTTTLPTGPDGTPRPTSHITLHELIHGERLLNGMDLSYRTLALVARLKVQFPEFVHVLLGNHELAQAKGQAIIKDGVRSVEAFSQGLEYAFGGDADEVAAAVREFVFSMPLALRAHTPRGDILCCHSLPTVEAMQRFDTTILSRELIPRDYESRTGSAHLLVWGRNYDAGMIEDLVERWGVGMFLIGHEKAEQGVRFVPPCAVVLNSDHVHGVYLPVDLGNPPKPERAADDVVSLAL
jgi:hypothetical protein